MALPFQQSGGGVGGSAALSGGWFFAPWGDWAGVYAQTVCGTSAAGNVRVMEFVLPTPLIIGHMTININVTDNGGNFFAGIYSSSGNLLVQATYALTAATGPYTVSASASLPAGVYFLAWSQDNGTVNALAAGSIVNAGQTLFNKNSARVGIAANTSSGGLMPSTLGAIAPSTQAPLACLLEA